MPIFPQYGPYQFEDPLIIALNAGLTGDVFDVTGKGVMSGGFTNIGGSDDIGNIFIYLSYDGVEGYQYSLQDFQYYAGPYAIAELFVCSYFDPVGEQYLIHPVRGFTFTEGFKLTITNNSVDNITCGSNYWWQRVI